MDNTPGAYLLESLNEAQRKAVITDNPRLLILAGAGSGKTRALIHRMAWYVHQKGLLPSEILAVTFTNKAAKEMQHRLQQLIHTDTHYLWVGTFHAIAHRLLRYHSAEANLPDNFQIIDSEDQIRLIKQIVKQQGLDEESMPAKKVAYFISRNKEEARRANQCVINSHESQVLQAIYQQYESMCFRQGLLDFSELLLRAYELWQQHPDILAQYQKRFKHVLVDEFQDTNTIQYLWLKQLVHDGNAVTVVGDDDQSIYGWRGAKIENIQQFTQDYHNVEIVRLEQNYRSTKVILNAANQLISQNEGRMGKELWTESEGKEKIQVYGAFNETDEARFIVTQIQQSLRQGYNAQDIAILYRSNAQSRILEQLLRQYDIPYRVYGGMRFFERAEIKDALAYLRVVRHEADDPAFERIINMPPRGIGERTLEKIREIAQDQQMSLWGAANQYVETTKGSKAVVQLTQFLGMMASLRVALSSYTLPRLLEYLYQQSGLLEYYQLQSGEKSESKAENLQELLIACQQYHEQVEADPAAVLAQFLSDCALEAGSEIGEESGSVVQLMTLHSAKGLEFKIVFIAGLEEGLFPNRHSMQDKKKLEEERRLCYVGITRAMQRLTLSYALRRGYGSYSAPTRLSRFVQEIPAALLNKINVNESAPVHNTKPSSLTPKGTGPFQVGAWVSHAKFGDGVILSQEGQGESLRVQIQFKQAGCKWLVLSYANLKPLDTLRN
jgi:DNA helicase-2/ATP-dependent DNA helicase PcrA